MRLLLIALLTMAYGSNFAAEWITCYENEQVKITYQYADCHDEKNGIHQQKVLLRFENKTQHTIAVSYGFDLTYSGTENTLEGDFKLLVVRLDAEEVKEATCTERDRAMFLFSKHLDHKGSVLENFKLTNVQVKTF